MGAKTRRAFSRGSRESPSWISEFPVCERRIIGRVAAVGADHDQADEAEAVAAGSAFEPVPDVRAFGRCPTRQ
jgi:hypothetical protein